MSDANEYDRVGARLRTEAGEKLSAPLEDGGDAVLIDLP